MAADRTPCREAIFADSYLSADLATEARRSVCDPTSGQGLCVGWAEQGGSDERRERYWPEVGDAVSDRSTHHRCRLRSAPMAGWSGRHGCRLTKNRERCGWKRSMSRIESRVLDSMRKQTSPGMAASPGYGDDGEDKLHGVATAAAGDVRIRRLDFVTLVTRRDMAALRYAATSGVPGWRRKLATELP